MRLLATDLVELFAIPGVRRSAVALLAAGLSLPIVGVFIIGLDVITVRFAVMHVALLGIAVALWIGIEPQLLALGLCALAGVLLAPLADRPGGLAGPMSFLMTVAVAAALLVLSISGVNANGAFEILWGSILATRTPDLLVIIAVACAIVGVYLRTRRSLGLLLFDRELAACSGVAVGGLTAVLLVLIAVSIGATIRVTGALLVDSVTLLPALSARNIARSFSTTVAWAVALGLLGNTVGYLAALQFDQPPGPTLVLVAGAITLVTFALSGRAKRLGPVPTH